MTRQVMLRRKASEWTHLGFVWSETELGVEYEIKRRDADGHVGCACPRYAFTPGVKSCKHILAFNVMPVQEQRQAPSVRVVVMGEAFTVKRRGISLGPLSSGDVAARR